MTDIPPSVLSEASRIIGAGNTPPQELADSISRMYTQLRKAERPKHIYKIFTIQACSDSVTIDSSLVLRGADIARICAHCSRAILMAVTLGAETDRLIQKTQLLDMADASVLDACASAEVERLCDRVEAEIMAGLDDGEFLTMRFSPGYGNVPLEDSAKIVSALEASKKIGLSMTVSGMHVPIKSVTALIGISDRPEPREKSCSFCGINQSCKYRNRGDFCGTQNIQ